MRKEKGFLKNSQKVSSFHAKIVVEGFPVEYRKKNPGLVCVHFCIAGVLGGVDGRVTGWSPVLGNGVGAQHGALVGLERELLGQDPILQQAGIAFGLFGRKLSDAEDKLQAPQLDVAAVVQQGRALPAGPTAPNQARAAGFAVAGSPLRPLGLGAHHGCLFTWLFILFLVPAAPWERGEGHRRGTVSSQAPPGPPARVGPLHLPTLKRCVTWGEGSSERRGGV